jgi:hypothetical protein
MKLSTLKFEDLVLLRCFTAHILLDSMHMQALDCREVIA